MSTVFVTGASGFIGGHLVSALVERGDRVRCLVRANSRIEHLPQLDVELVTGDVRQTEVLQRAVRGVDVVYHVAGLSQAFSANDFCEINVGGTRHVLQACADQPHPPVAVYVSSVSAAGAARRSCVRRETDPPAPISHYGRSKREAERVAESFAPRVPITVVRPGIVFGPRGVNSFKTFELIARLGMHAVPGCLDTPPLSFIYVTDLVDTLIAAADRGSRLDVKSPRSGVFEHGYYFACDAEYLSYLEFGFRIARAVGRRRLYIMRMPELFVWLAASLSEMVARVNGRPDIFGFDKVREATAGSWACSGERARRELDCVPRCSLDERLCETAQWYRENHWL